MGLRRDFSLEKIREAIENSKSFRQVIKYLKCNEGGGNYKTLKKICEDNNIDTSHFHGKGWMKNKSSFNALPLEEVLVENSDYTGGGLKKRILKSGLLEYKCHNMDCEIKEEWLGKKIVLQLDHINGDRYDNRIENLRFLCPNCHSQTFTYCGKVSNKKIRKCKKCGNKITRQSKSGLCNPCSNKSRSKPTEVKKCLSCRMDFIPKEKDQKFCSTNCYHNFGKEKINICKA